MPKILEKNGDWVYTETARAPKVEISTGAEWSTT
jgi:hypothetical protein